MENVKGTEIEWKEGQNLCMREVKKKQRQKGSILLKNQKEKECSELVCWSRRQKIDSHHHKVGAL